jgi:hypothetical protein
VAASVGVGGMAKAKVELSDAWGRGGKEALRGLDMDKNEFGAMVDRTGLTLTEAQKSVLFGAYPLFQAMVARATPPTTREAEPSVIFVPEVK